MSPPPGAGAPSSLATRNPASASATPSAARLLTTGAMAPQTAPHAASSRKQSANSSRDSASAHESVAPSRLSKASPGRIGYTNTMRPGCCRPSGPAAYRTRDFPCGRRNVTAARRFRHWPARLRLRRRHRVGAARHPMCRCRGTVAHSTEGVAWLGNNVTW
ncbi:hypothetical protein BAE44_0000371 [Dichanthelium oligosanthes]|uniref:Uncharacterized protein n=1 Tax=Dichanthelium oligosanthes TaxID=888268 RepID=A0A1E5WMJ8_9POAL|nr:hypothetical protein BAE44_0000371 [Dichanthelium oligosanthes]